MTHTKHIGIGDWWVYADPPEKDKPPKLSRPMPKRECPICGKKVTGRSMKLHQKSIGCVFVSTKQYLKGIEYDRLVHVKNKWLPYLEKTNVDIHLLTWYRKKEYWIPRWVTLVINTFIVTKIRLYDPTKLLQYVNKNEVAQSLIKKTKFEKNAFDRKTMTVVPRQMMFLMGGDNSTLLSYLREMQRGDKTLSFIPKRRTFTEWVKKLPNIIIRDPYNLTNYELIEVRKMVEIVPETLTIMWEIQEEKETGKRPKLLIQRLEGYVNKSLETIDEAIERWDNE